MTKALYLDDSYLKEFETKVMSMKDGKFAVFKETAFYPNGGGQLFDIGKIIRISDGKEFKIVYVIKIGDLISHEIEGEGLKEGDEIKGIIDWERRHKLMRSHTASHIISAVFHKEAGALITGNQLGLDKSRVDFNLESFDREKIDEYFRISNEIVGKDYDVKVSYMEKTEAEKNPAMFKLAKSLPESLKTIRVVSIGDYDHQADGGTHVKKLSEVGKIKFLKAENKGKNNRRVYFCLE